MKRYCRWCRQIVDYQIWTESTRNTQKQGIVCPKCEHPRSWMIRRWTDGKVIQRWSDPQVSLVEKQPEVINQYKELFGDLNAKA